MAERPRDSDTSMCKARRDFPTTSWADLLRIQDGSADERQKGLEGLILGYWRPVYRYVRTRWSMNNEDAKDMTQLFFADLIEKNWLRTMVAGQGRLRAFLLQCLKHFLIDRARAAEALKRRGGIVKLPADLDDALLAAPGKDADPEREFEKEWRECVIREALSAVEKEMRAEDRQNEFKLFREYYWAESEGGEKTYRELAEKHSLSVVAVYQALMRGRQRFRNALREIARESVASPTEAEDELRQLIGG